MAYAGAGGISRAQLHHLRQADLRVSGLVVGSGGEHRRAHQVLEEKDVTDKYILDDQGEPVPEPDTLKWGAWMQGRERQLAFDEVGDARVSTVFLGLNHSFLAGGPPV